MKINEKNLCNFAVSKTPIDKEGWLNKKGEVYKTFQRRWFILKGNLLFYFERKEDKEPIGVIILEGGTVELAENEDIHAFKLVFHGANCRTYILSANDQDSTEEWMKALATASYDYIKLMVAELQRQLDDINETEKRSQTMPYLLTNLPSNSSDTCLYAHTQSLKNKRFNPFDSWDTDPHTANNVDFNVQTHHLSTSTSDSNIVKQNTQSESGSNQSKYTFLELHEYYGQIFRRVFDDNREKRDAAKEQQLIVFD